MEARTEFRRLLAEKLRESETCLSSENTMEHQWNYISFVLYDSAAKSIGYKSKNHQDWFDDNSDIIHNLLKDMRKAHRETLDNPSSVKTRQHWQAARRKVQKDIRAIQNEWWTEKAHEIQSFAD